MNVQNDIVHRFMMEALTSAPMDHAETLKSCGVYWIRPYVIVMMMNQCFSNWRTNAD